MSNPTKHQFGGTVDNQRVTAESENEYPKVYRLGLIRLAIDADVVWTTCSWNRCRRAADDNLPDLLVADRVRA